MILVGMDDRLDHSIRHKPFASETENPRSGCLHPDPHAKLNYSKTA